MSYAVGLLPPGGPGGPGLLEPLVMRIFDCSRPRSVELLTGDRVRPRSLILVSLLADRDAERDGYRTVRADGDSSIKSIL